MKKLTLTSLVVFSMIAAHVAHADSEELINPDNGHSYKRFDAAKTWVEAKSACEGQGSHLATISSKIENDWIWHKFGISPAYYEGQIGFWLGGSDAAKEGRWTWITGEVWNYVNWSHGQPDNGNPAGQNYNAMWAQGGGWDDGSTDSRNSYLCEWEQPRNTYSRIITLPDINANNSQDFALIGGFANNYILFVYDGESQEIINRAVIQEKLNNHIESIKVTPDQNKNGASELAIVISNDKTQTSILQLQDTLTGDVLKKTTLPNHYSRTIALSDINSNGTRDFALVGGSDNDYLLFVYDGDTQAMISKAVISEKANYKISSLTQVKDSNNNGAPELAILIIKVSDGSAVLQLQDTLTGDVLKTITLPNQ